MKFLGQYIQSFTSRFRSDIYLERISTGTIASGGHLGLDSNDKIVKAVDGGGDVTLAGIQTFTGAKTFSAATTTFTSATADSPLIKVLNTTNDDQAGQLIFDKLRDDNAVASGQNLGEIWFRGQDSAQNATNYAVIYSEIDVSIDGQESGILKFALANDDAGIGTGLTLTGGSLNNEIDVTVGLGAGSVTTIAGGLTVNGDTTTFSSANADDPTVIIENTTADTQGARLQMKKDRGAAMVQGDRVGEIDFIGEDAGENFAQYGKILVRADVVTEDQESGKMMFQVANHDSGLETGLTLVGGSEDGEIDATLGLGANSITTVAGTLTMGSTASMGNTGLLTVGAQTGITAAANLVTVGTIGTGVWQGTAIASAYLDADTSHMSVQRHMTHHGFQDDMDTTKQYVGLIDSDSENTATTNGDLPQVFPTAGKLLKVFLRTNQNLSGVTLTWRLETQAVGVGAGGAGGPSIVGTQSGAGSTNSSITTYDFTSSLDGGTNAIAAGDLVFLSVESDGSTPNTKYYITCLWEVDLS